MNREIFVNLSSLIYQESGIVLPEEKAPLLSNRIQKRLRALGLRNEKEYLQVLKQDRSGEEIVNLIDVVSTNVTSFYREPRHFEIFGDILDKWKKEKRGEIKIWCAAASSGEEPYTIAFEVAAHGDLRIQKVRILATDICTAVLSRAARGFYRDKDVAKVPAARLKAYLIPHEHQGERLWKVKDEITRLLMFKKFNLIQFPYPLHGPIDIIFCRNVMIYFDLETRSKIIQQFEQLLRTGGFLFLSHSENLLGVEHHLTRYDTSVFQKIG